jgi:DNA-binding NarL/FixJ family response regulator
MQKHRFLIADDHPLFRGALQLIIDDHFKGAETIQCGNFDEVVTALQSDRTMDLILLDLTMPAVQGFSGLIYLRSQYPDLPVVVVSAREEPGVIRRCINFGASGFIPKSLEPAAMADALAQVLNGEIWYPEDTAADEENDELSDLAERMSSLTPQQMRVLMMLGQGLLNKQIAYELSVSEATVKAHVSAILQKLNVDSRTQAVIAANKLAMARTGDTV